MPSDDPWLCCSKKFEDRISATQVVVVLFFALKIASRQGSNRLVAALPGSAGLTAETPPLCEAVARNLPPAEELVCHETPDREGLTGVVVLFDVEGDGAE